MCQFFFILVSFFRLVAVCLDFCCCCCWRRCSCCRCCCCCYFAQLFARVKFFALVLLVVVSVVVAPFAVAVVVAVNASPFASNTNCINSTQSDRDRGSDREKQQVLSLPLFNFRSLFALANPLHAKLSSRLHFALTAAPVADLRHRRRRRRGRAKAFAP